MSERSEKRAALRNAVEELLAADFEARQLVKTLQQARVCKEWYLRKVGLSTRSPVASDIFARYDDLAREAMTIDDGVAKQLDEYIEGAIASGLLAVKTNSIVRKRIGRFFGFDRKDLEHPVIKSCLDRWDANLPADYQADTRAITREDLDFASRPLMRRSVFAKGRYPLRNGRETAGAKLEKILSEHLRDDTFIRDRYGRLARDAYAGLIGVNPTNITDHLDILQNYERLSGPVISDTERKIPDIVQWFWEMMKTKSLPLVGKRIHQDAIMARFQITRSELEGCQPLLDEVERLNGELAKMGYLGDEDAKLFAALTRRLPKAKLGKDGYQFDRSALARSLACSSHKLDTEPFRGAIKTAETEHRARIEASALWVCFPERAVDYSWLVRIGWSEAVVGRICEVFKEQFLGKKGEQRRRMAHAIGEFFKKLANISVEAVRMAFAAVNARRGLVEHDWKTAIDEMGRSEDANLCAYFNTIIKMFGDDGIIPATTYRLKIREKRNGKGGRKTFAEATPYAPKAARAKKAGKSNGSPELASTVAQYVSFAQWVLLQKSDWEEEGDSFRGDDFLEVLQAEIEAWDGELPKDPVQAISMVIKKRIALVSEAAKALFDQWRRHYEEGQELLPLGADPDEYVATLMAGRTKKGYRQALETYFPENDRRMGLANLLRLIRDRYDGIVPIANEGDRVMRVLTRRYGSLAEIQAYLIPHRDASAAALTMYLGESGCNIAVALTLFRDCIEPVDIYGYKKITGWKARAKGKPIVINLPEDSHALNALAWLAVNNELARSAAPKDVKEHLFLARIQGTVSEITDAWFLNRFKRIVRSVKTLRYLALRPSMMRPSVLLCHALENDGDLRVGLSYGQHDPNQTGVYQVRLPTKYIYDKLYAQFQKRIEAIILRMASELRRGKKPSIDSKAKPIGIGGVCAIGGCKELRCWNNCSNLAVLPEISALADWQIWNRSLKEVRVDWETSRIERWEAMWLPFLCFTDVLGEKMKVQSNSLRKMWNEATALADRIMSTEGFVIPRPF
ncbi:hypothetical protein GOE08_06585 [Sinorhizobium medicae]|nr:hypothetical protein [Sinorhizobium medicae]MDX1006552.1 hypothetical protein [Sinorhizobium medicae]